MSTVVDIAQAWIIWSPTAIKLSAERKAGELLAAMPKSVNRHSSTSTVTELGITHTQSSRWQRAAKVPEEAFAA